MPYKYSAQYDNEKMARAVVMSASISLKKSIEICNFIRNKRISDAKMLLEDVLKEKRAVPFKRFRNGAGHKKKIGPGKYPKKTSVAFINLLNVAEANAQNKGLSTADLIVHHICANKASSQMHYGRKRGRKMKRTHVEVYIKEEKREEKKVKGRNDPKENKETKKSKEVVKDKR